MPNELDLLNKKNTISLKYGNNLTNIATDIVQTGIFTYIYRYIYMYIKLGEYIVTNSVVFISLFHQRTLLLLPQMHYACYNTVGYNNCLSSVLEQ